MRIINKIKQIIGCSPDAFFASGNNAQTKPRSPGAKNASGLLRKAFIFPIRLYHLAISPLLGNCCRFEPSCSTYAVEAITIHGCLKGSWLALRRIVRCHPWHPGGKDEVDKLR